MKTSALAERLCVVDPASRIYPNSCFAAGDTTLAVVRVNGVKMLCEAAADADALSGNLAGELQKIGDDTVKLCPFTHANALALRELLPWTAPISLRDRKTTIGCGDRLGLATPGHIRAARQFAVAPVLAQQSIRELTLTGRTYENVVDDVTFLVLQEGHTDGYGADGDHLKTLDDINVAVDAGMAMITLDLTEKMNADAEKWSQAEVEAAFAKLAANVQERIVGTYADRTFDLADETVRIEALEAKRCAVMYLAAMDFSREVYDLLRARRDHAFERI